MEGFDGGLMEIRFLNLLTGSEKNEGKSSVRIACSPKEIRNSVSRLRV
jgi:hypothetical protein